MAYWVLKDTGDKSHHSKENTNECEHNELLPFHAHFFINTVSDPS